MISIRNFLLGTALAVLFFLIRPGQSDAQFVISNTYIQKTKIIKADPPPGEKAEIGINLLDVQFGFTLYSSINEQKGTFTELRNSLGYRNQSVTLDIPAGDDEYFPKNLSAVNYTLELAQSLGDKWYLVSFGSAGLYSDFENIDGDHYLFEGGAFFIRKVSRNIDLGIGPVFTYAFGEPVLIPAPFIKFTSTGRTSFEMQVPRYAKLGYAVSENLQLGVNVKSLYNNYTLGDTRAELDGESTVLVFSDLTVGIESTIRLLKPLALNLGAGTTFDRKFVVNDNGGDELFDRGMEDAIFFTAGLSAEF